MGRDDDAEWVTEEIRLPGVDDEPDGAGAGPVGPRGRMATALPGAEPLAGAPPAATVTRRDGAARRERRQTLTFLALFLLIIAIGVLALLAYFGKVPMPVGSGKPTPLPTCPAAEPSVQAARDTSVNVYNASSRNGLALTVQRELQKRGFRSPTNPTNDKRTKVTTMAVIRHGPTGALAARTVAAQVAGEVTFVEDARAGADVDLVLGQTFALAPRVAASASPTVTVAAKPTCQPASG